MDDEDLTGNPRSDSEHAQSDDEPNHQGAAPQGFASLGIQNRHRALFPFKESI
jgi:hypothetical protein